MFNSRGWVEKNDKDGHYCEYAHGGLVMRVSEKSWIALIGPTVMRTEPCENVFDGMNDAERFLKRMIQEMIGPLDFSKDLDQSGINWDRLLNLSNPPSPP